MLLAGKFSPVPVLSVSRHDDSPHSTGNSAWRRGRQQRPNVMR